MKSTEKKISLSAQAFWDFDTSKLDFEKFADYTVSRVLERGNDSDYHQIVDFYGTRRLRSIVSKAPLSPRARHVAQRLLRSEGPKAFQIQVAGDSF